MWGNGEDDPDAPTATWERRMWPSPDSNFSSLEQVITTLLLQPSYDDKVGELSAFQVAQGVPSIAVKAISHQ